MVTTSQPGWQLKDAQAIKADLSTLNNQPSTAGLIGILHKWGIHTLGQLAVLDQEELRKRLGPEAIRLWQQASGRSTRLLKFVQPPESFEESFEFENEIETAEPLFFMLRRFLEQLALRLGAIYLVANELTLRITFTNRQTYVRVFKIPQPTNEVDLLFRMLQTHLENFTSPHPVAAVALMAQPIRPVSQQFGLFETALRNPHQLYETLARLNALLGADRVGTPVLEETHRPDAFRMEPFLWKFGGTTSVSSHSSDMTEHVPPILRPVLRRFRPAASATIFKSASCHLQSGPISGKVIDRRGPYLASGDWWHEKSWERAEWDLQLNDGTLCRCHQNNDSTWKIDGIYD